MERSDFNDVYRTLKDKDLVDNEKLRGNLLFHRSPGKGIKAGLLLDYNDLSREKRSYSGRYAYVLNAVFLEEMSGVYQGIANRNVKKYGRTPQANLMATLEMLDNLDENDGAVVFADTELLNDEHLMRTIGSNRHFQSVLEKVNSGKLRTSPPPACGIDFQKTFHSMEQDVGGRVSLPEGPLELHESWDRHYKARERAREFLNGPSM